MLDIRLSSPVTVFLNITSACNLRCIYCSASSGVPSPDDLSSDELRHLIDELIELKVCKVIVTGGEPFVRTDIFDLLEHMKHGGITLSLISNGTMIRPSVARRLVELDLWDLSISLDGATPAVNDSTRGEGAFERSMLGVRTLLDHGIRPTILVTVTSLNFSRIGEITDSLVELGVNGVAFNLMAPQGRGEECSGLELGPAELQSYAEDLRSASRRHPSFVREDFLHWYELPRRLAARRETQSGPARKVPCLLPCDAAKAGCAIGSDGAVYPCNRLIHHPCGNIREQSLAEIWLGERMERVRALGKMPTSAASGCSRCKYTEVCAGGCRALADFAFGDLEAPDPSCSVVADAGVHASVPTGRPVHLGEAPTR